MSLKKRFLGTLSAVPGLAGLAFLGLWGWLAQPTVRKSKPSERIVSAEALEKHVRTISEELSPRSVAHLGNLSRTADYIKNQFETVGAGHVSDQVFEAVGRRFRNVSLLLGELPSPRIVVGAHYDGYGPYPGADDNASGVAGLIELARLLAREPVPTPVELVAYSLEEPPFFGTDDMGSHRHAMRLDEGECRYMVSLEMIGFFSDEPGSQSYPLPLLRLFYPGTGNYIAVVGNTANRGLIGDFKVGMRGTTDLPVRSVCAPASLPGIDFSDHRNYWRAGIPAIMVTDTAFYRNTAYHTPRDTADRLDYDRMAKVVVAVFEAIRRTEGCR